MKAEVASFGQLSPPFQLPQPLGAVAGFSVGIEVGMIGGGMTGDTEPPGTTEVVVTDEEEELTVDNDDDEVVDVRLVVELLLI